MGCHTWFYNKISEMPIEHYEKMKAKIAKQCRNAYIVKCSCSEWVKGGEKELAHYNGKNSEVDKSFAKFLKEISTKEYYEKKRNEYIKDAELLENPNTPRKKVLRIFAKHKVIFDKGTKDGYYELGEFGWHDKYRVYGYPDGNFKSAEEAIKFLEEYDNGNNIIYDFKKGMCDEIRDIINNFFKEYPNGYINYG
jgi:hypothetical protein